MDNLLEVCEEMGLDVDYLSLKERGELASCMPMKEAIRAFNLSEEFPNSVTIVLDKDEAAKLFNASQIINRRLCGEELPELPMTESPSTDLKLIFCNGVVCTWDESKSVSRWRDFFNHCLKEEDYVCRICNTSDIPITRFVSCRICYKWLCKTCAEKLTINQCPACRSFKTLSCAG